MFKSTINIDFEQTYQVYFDIFGAVYDTTE